MTPQETLQNYLTRMVDLNTTLMNLNRKHSPAPDPTNYKQSITKQQCLQCLAGHVYVIGCLVESTIKINVQDGYAPQTIVAIDLWYAQNEKLFDEVEAILKQPAQHFGVAM